MNISSMLRRSKQLVFTSASAAAGAASLYGIAPEGMARNLCAIGLTVSALLVAMSMSLAVAAWWIQSRGTTVSASRPAVAGDLIAIREMAVSFFGEKVSSLERMLAWHKRYPNAFSIVNSVHQNGAKRVQQLAGYFVVLPLRKNAVDAVRNGTQSIVDLRDEDVSGPRELPAAIYIGVVAAADPVARGAALQSLLVNVRAMAKNRLSMPVITKPVTRDGLRIVTACGLTPTQETDGDAVGVVHASTLGEVLGALRTGVHKSR